MPAAGTPEISRCLFLGFGDGRGFCFLWAGAARGCEPGQYSFNLPVLEHTVGQVEGDAICVKEDHYRLEDVEDSLLVSFLG